MRARDAVAFNLFDQILGVPANSEKQSVRDFMRTATCNVHMLQLRLDALLDQLIEEDVDLALLQESRLTSDAIPAVQRYAWKRGYRLS